LVRRFTDDRALPKGFARGPLRWQLDTLAWSFHLDDDPDAPRGTFTHWLAWNIAATARGLRAGQRAPREGTNDAGQIGYTGPCPPSGVHHYVFRLYALEAPLKLTRGASRAQFLAALRGRSLAVATLVGRYGR
jgi:Raf kinase inhibitor-like YbhB/YbcL family protein